MMSKKGLLGLAAVIGGIGLLASRRASPAGGSLPPGAVPIDSPEKAARLKAALEALRMLVTTPGGQARTELIRAFQVAAEIPNITGKLDDITMDAARAATHGQADGTALMAGIEAMHAQMIAEASPPTPGPGQGPGPSQPAPAVPLTETPTVTPPRGPIPGQTPGREILARAVVDTVAKSGANYNRATVKAFQKSAGIRQDGLYGEDTRAALIRAGVPASEAPAAIATAKGRVAPAPPTPGPVTPPPGPSGGQSTARQRLAEVVARNLELAKSKYNRESMKAYQKSAALNPDGLYGPRTRDALITDGIADERLPPPMFGVKKS